MKSTGPQSNRARANGTRNGKKQKIKRQPRRPKQRKAARGRSSRPVCPSEMDWSFEVLGEKERAELEEDLQESVSMFEVVSVEPGRGVWVREIGPFDAWRLAIPFLRRRRGGIEGAVVLMEDVQLSRVFEQGNLFTGKWQEGKPTMPRAMRESILACPTCNPCGTAGCDS